eukprot:3916390-Prymnesium_polylepis.1
MVRGWSGDGQGMVRGWSGDGQASGVKSERSLQLGQRAEILAAPPLQHRRFRRHGVRGCPESQRRADLVGVSPRFSDKALP